jgi:hypothetical protein
VPQATAETIGLKIDGVLDKTGAGVVPAPPVDCPPLDLTADAPVAVIPETLKTLIPPPVPLACVAVNVVDEEAGIKAFLTQASKTPVVENPVLSTST